MTSISNAWSRDTGDCQMKKLPAFGSQEWLSYLNIAVEAPEIPEHFIALLGSPCPFIPGRLVEETHMLCLVIPEGLDGIREQLKLGHHPFSDSVTVPEKPYWILITKMVIPGTEFKPFSDQCGVIGKKGYSPPTTLEACTAVLAAKCLGNVELFKRELTKCSEEVGERPLAVGFDNNVVFSVSKDRYQQYGVAGTIRSASNK